MTGADLLLRVRTWCAGWRVGVVLAVLAGLGSTPSTHVLAKELLNDDVTKPAEETKSEEDDAQKVQPTQSPEALIKLLATGDYDQRQEALRELAAHEEAARPALQKALETCEDLEVRSGLLHLLSKLNRASIEFTVVDRHGKPLPEISATLNLRPDGQNRFVQNQNKMLTTDKKGQFKVENLESGPAQAYIQWKDTALAPYLSWSNRLYVAPGVNHLRFVAIAPGALKGSIQDAESGKPLDDATLTLVNAGFELDDNQKNLDQMLQRFKDKTTSDEKGVFTFEKATCGTFALVAQHEKCYPVLIPDVQIEEGTTLELEAAVKLKPRPNVLGKLKITILGKDGKPYKKQKVGYSMERVTQGEESKEDRKFLAQNLMRWGWNQQAQPSTDTDDKGVLELDELEPGRYRVTLQIKDAPDVVLKDVEIKPQETTELKKIKPPAGATVEGRLLSTQVSGMGYAQIWAIDESESSTPLILGDLNRYHGWLWQRRRNSRGRADGYAQADEHGSYKITNLTPATYSLVIRTRNGRFSLIHGLHLEAGKTLRAPDFEVVPRHVQKAVKGDSDGFHIKGQVLLPDGTPAVRIGITLMYGSGSWGASTDQNGHFSFVTQNRHMGFNQGSFAPRTLVINQAGYRPLRMDLRGKGTRIENLNVRLEPQRYGKLDLTVTDLQGKPIAGARLNVQRSNARSPFHRGNMNAANAFKKSTNSAGQASIDGLAWGSRKIKIDREGYYLPGGVASIEIKPDETTQLKVVLHPGLSIKGKVLLPEGRDVGDLVVTLQEFEQHAQLTRTTVPGPDGSFSFTGLEPGGFRLDVQCHDLRPLGETFIELTDTAVNRDLKLVKAGGFKLDLGPALGGAYVTIMEPGGWKIELQKASDTDVQHKKATNYFGGLTLDASGRGTYYGVPPGEYDLTVRPSRNQGMGYNPYKPSHAQGQCIIRGVRIESLPGGIDALKTLAALKHTLPSAKAQVEGSLNLLAPAGKQTGEEDDDGDDAGNPFAPMFGGHNNNSMRLQVHLIGPDVQASHGIHLNRNWRFHQQVARLGVPPAGIEEKKSTETFIMEHLPAGEYKLFVDVTVFRYVRKFNARGHYQTMNEPYVPANLPELAPLKTIVLKEGEKLDLGTLDFTVPAWATDALTENKFQDNEDEDEDDEEVIGQDRIPVFSP